MSNNTLKFEQLQNRREQLCKAMRDGYQNLSQARYSMGNKAVRSLQYSEKMKASTVVEVSENISFEIQKSEVGTDSYKEEANEETPWESVLRKRKGNSQESVEESNVSLSIKLKAVEDLNGNEKSRELKDQPSNTLNWFGVLVPMCLRTGQGDFKTAVELCCELVNLENDMKNLIKEYRIQKDLKRS